MEREIPMLFAISQNEVLYEEDIQSIPYVTHQQLKKLPKAIAKGVLAHQHHLDIQLTETGKAKVIHLLSDANHQLFADTKAKQSNNTLHVHVIKGLEGQNAAFVFTFGTLFEATIETKNMAFPYQIPKDATERHELFDTLLEESLNDDSLPKDYFIFKLLYNPFDTHEKAHKTMERAHRERIMNYVEQFEGVTDKRFDKFIAPYFVDTKRRNTKHGVDVMERYQFDKDKILVTYHCDFTKLDAFIAEHKGIDDEKKELMHEQFVQFYIHEERHDKVVLALKQLLVTIDHVKGKVKRLLNSELSSYAISKETGVAVGTIYNVREGKAELENLTLKTIEALYRYALVVAEQHREKYFMAGKTVQADALLKD